MVKAYFESVGMDARFHYVYEETKPLTDYCEEQAAERMIDERVEQILQRLDMLDINTDKISEYSVDVLSEVFNFVDVDYYTGIKVFGTVMNKLGFCMEQREQYELFDRIYEEGMQEMKQERNRGGR